jgi:O-antigen/teichoic acid export membrane protein
MRFPRVDIVPRKAVLTTVTKIAILFVNFLIVAVTARLWGSSGRGEMALVIANISIINILSNIFCGNTVTYHASRENRDMLLLTAFGGSLVLSVITSLGFSLSIGLRYLPDLFIISFLSSLTGTIALYWLGVKNVRLYNILTFLNPVLVLVFMLVFYYIVRISSVNACFYAYYAGLGSLFIIGAISLKEAAPFRFPAVTLNEVSRIVRYGFANEASYFLQFLNYRLAYFFIAKYLGLSQLGIFSIAVSCAEAVWVISKSLSTVHYSNVVNTKDRDLSIKETSAYARQSFWISLVLMAVITIIPKSFFEYTFGHGFEETKTYLVYLMPGILAIAVSNLYGHYFSGIGRLNILISKSAIGLFSGFILLIFLTKSYYLNGVCISLNVSYLLSSLFLFLKFRKEKQFYSGDESKKISGKT